MNTSPQPYDQALFQSVPTDAELRTRTSLPYQLWRFLQLNLKIMQVVRQSHRRPTGGGTQQGRKAD